MRLTGWYRFVFIEYGPELEEKIDPKNNTGFLFTTARMLRWQWCWWHRFVGDLMMVTIFRCWWHKKYIDDIPIGHQHHNMPECDVDDGYVMLCLIKIQPGAKFNTNFYDLYTNSEGLTSATNIIVHQNVWLIFDIGA